jgi:hypothetical protein
MRCYCSQTSENPTTLICQKSIEHPQNISSWHLDPLIVMAMEKKYCRFPGNKISIAATENLIKKDYQTARREARTLNLGLKRPTR